MLHCVFFLIYSYLPSGNIKKFNISLHKIGGTSAIKDDFIAFGLHYLCIR